MLLAEYSVLPSLCWKNASSRELLRAESSATVVWASRRPWPITTRWSAVWAISLIRWLEMRTVRPCEARFFSRPRIQRMPSGSSPLTGSSSSSTAGSPSSAAAMPSRWAMPRENLPARRSAALPMPVISSTSLTRRRGMPLLTASAVRWARVERLGLQQRADFAQRPAQLVVVLTVDPGRPGVRPVQAEQHPHRGGLAGAVRAEETGHRPGPHVEAEVVHGGGGAVALDQAACLDHEMPPVVLALWCGSGPGPRAAGTLVCI